MNFQKCFYLGRKVKLVDELLSIGTFWNLQIAIACA